MTTGSDAITAPLGRGGGAYVRGLGPFRVGVLAVLFLFFIGLGYFAFTQVWGDGQKPAPNYSIGTATRSTITSIANASGTVSAVRQVKLSFTSGGRLAKLLVKQGDSVKEGQELADLDATTLTIKRDTARSQLQAANIKLQTLIDGPTSVDIAAQQQAVASAQSNLTRAQNDLNNVITGITADDVTAAKANLDRAQAALDVAQSNYDKIVRGEDLQLRSEYSALNSAKADYQTALTNYNNKLTPNANDVAAARSALTSAQSAVDAAQSKLNTLLSPNPADVIAARATVTSAQNGLDAAQARLTQLLNPNPSDVSSAEAAVSSAKAQLESAKAKYASMVIGASKADQDAAQAAVDAAQLSVDSAIAKRSQVMSGSGSTEADIASANAAVAQAQSQLANAQATLRSKQAQTGGPELAAAEQAVHAAESALTTAQNSLAKLNNPLPADLSAAQQQVAAAQSQLTNAQTTLDKLLNPQASDVLAAQQQVSAAQSTLSNAQSNLDKIVNPSADDVAQVKAALDRAKAALDTAQINWDRLVNKTDLDQRPEATALKAAQSDYQAALNSYTTKAAGPKSGDVNAARSAVDSAGAALAAAQAKLDQMKAGSLPSDIAAQQETVRQLELSLKQAETDLDAATLRAPYAGTVVATAANEGDQVGASTAVVTLLDPNAIRIDATLDESSVAKVKASQPAIVTFDAIQGRTYRCTVSQVTPAGVTQQGVVTFPVTIICPDAGGSTIPPGLTATVRIITDIRQNVVSVPSRAIKRVGRETTMDVLKDDGSTENRTVQLGLTGDSGAVEITSGLNEGDRVLIYAQSRTTTTTTGAFGVGGLGGPGPAAQPVRR